MPRLDPLPRDAVPELQEIFDRHASTRGFVPNSVLIMQRKPGLVKAFIQMSAAIFDPDGEVSLGLKRLLAYVVARTHGCHY